MIPLSLEVVAPLGALQAAGWTDEVTGVQVDSRRIEEGDLFVAVGGGADFTKHAFARGAAATLVPHDAHAALASIAGAVRERSDATVVAITGSMGKTTTKDILGAIAFPQRRTIAAERSYNNEIGVPLTLCRIDADTELVVLELAMRGFGQIAELSSFARPHVGVITMIAPVHLEKVGTLEGVIRAKGELLAALPAGGTVVVPADFAVERDDLRVVRVGQDVKLESFDPPRLRTSLGEVDVNFTARHLAQNALTAVATAHALGLEIPSRVDVAFADWRNQELELPGGGLVVNDAWNANPISMPSPPAGAASPFSARWRSSATTQTRVMPRSRAPCRRSASTCSCPSGLGRAPTAAGRSPTPPKPSPCCARSFDQATACSSRAHVR